MARNQTCLKNNHYAEQKHRLLHRKTATMRKRPGDKKLISLLACLVRGVQHRYFAETMAFNSLPAQVLPIRRYPKSTGQKWPTPWSPPQLLQPPPPFHTFFGVSVATSTTYFASSKSASTCLFSTSNSSSPPSNNAPKKTQYTIDDSVCLPTKEATLEKAVHKACRSLEVYLEKKPVAAHTRRAFEVLVEMIDEDQKRRQSSSSLPSTTMMYDGIILDSGCGTGRSTKLLASSIHPRHLVIGVDRSLTRLTKTKDNRQAYDDNNNDATSASERAAYCHQVSENAYLVRAELVDFYRCCIERGWSTPPSEPTGMRNDNNFESDTDNQHSYYGDGLKITHNYMLYPNPYPTNARLSSRWYAHPSFPLILKLGIQTMIVRSNWEGYLSEFAKAVEMANEFYVSNNEGNSTSIDDTHGESKMITMSNSALPYIDSAKKGPTERIDKSVAFTNFESKYDKVGEPTFELILERNER